MLPGDFQNSRLPVAGPKDFYKLVLNKATFTKSTLRNPGDLFGAPKNSCPSHRIEMNKPQTHRTDILESGEPLRNSKRARWNSTNAFWGLLKLMAALVGRKRSLQTQFGQSHTDKTDFWDSGGALWSSKEFFKCCRGTFEAQGCPLRAQKIFINSF